MAKTYNTFTNVSVGSVLTASDYNEALENIGNYRVPPLCSLFRNAALSHTSNGNYQSVAWDSQHFTQTDSGMWAASPNPTRITLVTAGAYQVTATATPGASATGLRIAAIYKNGAAAAYGDTTPGNATVSYTNVSALIESDGDDYVELFVFQSSGGNIAYSVGASTMRFTAAWLGQTT